MALLDQTSTEQAPAVDVTGWVLRISAGLLFLTVGAYKFNAHGYWVKLFGEIGLGDWFRYLTGTMQVAGGILFFVRRTVLAGAFLTGCTMVGAIFVHMFVLNTGFGGAVFPLVLLIFISVVAFRRSR